MKGLKIVTVLLVAMSVLFVSSYGQSEKAKEKKCPKTVWVLVEKIKSSDFKEYKDFSANFSPEVVTVRSTASGKITDVRIAEGDLVSQDWILAVINNALEEEIKKLEADIATWETTLRKRRGWKVRSERAEKQAENKLEELRKQLEEVKSEASKYTIKSPIAGTVKSLNVEKEIEISQDTVIATIVNDKKLVATMSVAEEDKALLSSGQKILFKINGIEDGLYAEVVEIKDNDVFFVIDNSEKKIEDSFTLEFRLLKKEYTDVVVLSKEQILKDENGSYVYMVFDKYAKKVYLKLGVEDEGKVLVMEGISAGDEIIVSEIISVKTGETSKELKCISDNKKIKIMEFDLKSKKYKKRKKIKLKKKITDEERAKAEVEARRIEEERIKAREEARKLEIAEKEKRIAEIKAEKEDAEKKKWETKKRITELKIKKIDKEKEKLEAEFAEDTEASERINKEIEELDREIIQNETELMKIDRDLREIDNKLRRATGIKVKRKVPRVVTGNRLGIGLAAGYTTVDDEDFKEVYSSGSVTGVFRLSYNFSQNYEIFLDITYAKGSGELPVVELPTDITMAPIYLGGKYIFKTQSKFKPHLGVSGVIFNVKEENQWVTCS